jgi:PhnB protein
MIEVPDSFEILRRPDQPATPSPGFAAELKAALLLVATDPTRSNATESDFTTRRTAMTTSTTTVVPYLCMTDAAAAIEFYTKAFDATESSRLVDPKDGRVGHAEIRIGANTLYMADEYPEIGVRSPKHADFHSTSFVVTVSDADAVFNQAVAAGATVERPLADQFYGDRSGTVLDPFGYRWMINSKIEDLTTDEQQRRYDEVGSDLG